MIRKHDICVVKDVSGKPVEVIKDNLGNKVRVSYMGEELCSVTVLEGKWQGHDVPCLVSRLEKWSDNE